MNEFYARTMLNTQRLEEETGLTPAQILALPMDEYARLTGRPTGSQLAGQAADPVPPGTPRQEPAPAQTVPQAPAPGPQAIDVQGMTMAEYSAVRGQFGVQGREYGRGILDGGSTADWIAAAQAKGGRHGWQGQNVVESPRIDRPEVRPDVQPDTRSATQRLSNPGTVWGN